MKNSIFQNQFGAEDTSVINIRPIILKFTHQHHVLKIAQDIISVPVKKHI